MKSMSMNRTEEMAVMFDTDRPLSLTPQAMSVDDPKYPMSWLESPVPTTPTGQFSG
jgi:homogentisate 1,2-dioxygenase